MFWVHVVATATHIIFSTPTSSCNNTVWFEWEQGWRSGESTHLRIQFPDPHAICGLSLSVLFPAPRDFPLGTMYSGVPLSTKTNIWFELSKIH